MEIEYSTNFKDGFLKALKNAQGSLRKTSTLTTKNIYGIRNLDMSTTYFGDVRKKDVYKIYDVEYTVNLNEAFELKITGEYSGDQVAVNLMIIDKRHRWSIGCELAMTLNPLGLCGNVSSLCSTLRHLDSEGSLGRFHIL